MKRLLRSFHNDLAMINLKALPAHDGDSFIIQYGDHEENVSNILIDGGRGQQIVRELAKEVERINNDKESIDLLVLTHIDEDHILGLLQLFELSTFNKECIKRVFFNSKSLLSEEFDGKVVEDTNLMINLEKEKISFKQGETFEKKLNNLNIEKMKIIESNCKPININGAQLTILSPDKKDLKKLYFSWEKAFKKENPTEEIKGSKTSDNISFEDAIKNPFKEDKDIVNRSSISFILEYEGRKILMLGDSHPSVVLKNLIKIYGETEIEFDLVKIAHHGSKSNTSNDLLSHIICKNYLVSTNKENRHGFPHKEALSRIVKNNISKNLETNFYFNYTGVGNGIFLPEEIEKYNIHICEKNTSEGSLKISL